MKCSSGCTPPSSRHLVPTTVLSTLQMLSGFMTLNGAASSYSTDMSWHLYVGESFEFIHFRDRMVHIIEKEEE